MDTSETYIKMCDCPEIYGEGGSPPYPTDYYAKRKRGATRYGYQIITADIVDGDYIWLPRQDQIQAMLGTDNKEPFCTWLERLGKFTHLAQPWDIPIDKNGLKTIGWFESWEQLWLAFYMHEKHKKIWNGRQFEAEK